jgi:hypothetical protein
VWEVPSLALGERFKRPTVRRPSSQDEREGSLFGVGQGWFYLFPNPQACWSFLEAAGSSFDAALPTPWGLRVEDFDFDKLFFYFPILALVLFCGLVS